MERVKIAAVETDQARVALAESALEDLEALAILAMQRGLLDVPGTERTFEALGRVQSGLAAGRKWMRLVRSGQTK